MYVDSPGDHVFSLFDELLFGRHPLGREIAGTAAQRAAREPRAASSAHWRALRIAPPPGPRRRGSDPATTRSVKVGERLVRRQRSPHRCPPPCRRRSDSRSPPRPGRCGSPSDVSRQGNLCLGMPGGGPRSSRSLGARPARRRPRRRDEQPPLRRAARAAFAHLRRLHLRQPPTPTAAPSASTPASTPIRLAQLLTRHPRSARAGRAGAGRAPRSSIARVPTPVAGSQLRMEETGAVAAWLGTGESLLPRILTVDEVIERLEAVTDRRPAARGARLRPSGSRPPGRARAVPIASALRADALPMTDRQPPPRDGGPAPRPALAGASPARIRAAWPGRGSAPAADRRPGGGRQGRPRGARRGAIPAGRVPLAAGTAAGRRGDDRGHPRDQPGAASAAGHADRGRGAGRGRGLGPRRPAGRARGVGDRRR